MSTQSTIQLSSGNTKKHAADIERQEMWVHLSRARQFNNNLSPQEPKNVNRSSKSIVR